MVAVMTDLKFRRSVRSPRPSDKPVLSLALAKSLPLLVICFATIPVCAWSGLSTTTALSVSSNAVTVGTAVLFTATVTDQNAAPLSSGQVVFCNAAAIYCEDIAVLGTAQLTSTGTAAVNLRLGVGSYSVKAVLVGTTTNAGSVSQPQSLTVSGQVPSTTALGVRGVTGNYALTATVTGGGRVAPTGSVTFEDSSNGNATVATVAPDPKTAALKFPLSNYDVGNGANAIAAGDFNGDGTPDIVAANIQDSTVSVLLGVGDGTFHTQVTYATGSSPRAVAIGDFNSDGKLDLVVANSNNGGNRTLSVLLGNGDGTFQTQQTIPLSNNPLSVAVGDFNNDGKPDLAVAAGLNTDEVNILLGNGNGTFQAQQTYALGGTPLEVAIGDFNRDGKLDLVVSNPFNNMVSVLLGNGDGTLQLPTTCGAGNLSGSVAVGDFNGDGKPDLAVANYGDNDVSVLLGTTATEPSSRSRPMLRAILPVP